MCFGKSCQPAEQRVIANMISGFQINDACYVHTHLHKERVSDSTRLNSTTEITYNKSFSFLFSFAANMRRLLQLWAKVSSLFAGYNNNKQQQTTTDNNKQQQPVAAITTAAANVCGTRCCCSCCCCYRWGIKNY